MSKRPVDGVDRTSSEGGGGGGEPIRVFIVDDHQMVRDGVRQLLDAQPDFDEALRTPRISHEEKVALLDRVFGGKMSPLVLNFLKVVSQHERLDCLRAIERAAQKLYNQMKNRVELPRISAQATTSLARTSGANVQTGLGECCALPRNGASAISANPFKFTACETSHGEPALPPAPMPFSASNSALRWEDAFILS